MNQEIVTQLDTEYYSLPTLPYGYINKTVCGCGMTTVAIENNRNTIIAVPNVSLIENKVNQYKNKNAKLRSRTSVELFGIKGGVTREDIFNEVNKQTMDMNQPIKMMVTYDSLWKVEWILSAHDCDLVIDESDMIIGYASLKSSSQKGKKDCISYMLEIAEKYKNKTSFISATPTPVEYMPEWIQNIPQHRIEFTHAMPVVPVVLRRYNPIKALKENVINPIVKTGIANIGNGISFTKAIIFINSISKIIESLEDIKDLIDQDEIGYICGDTVKNDARLKDVGYRLKDPTNLPKLTFVTGSGVRGIDLEDAQAMSVVVSDSNCQYTMFDMLGDLKQAASRQRNKQNTNYGKYLFIFNQSITDDDIEVAKIKFENEIAKVKRGIEQYESTLSRQEDVAVEAILKLEIMTRYTYFNDNNKLIMNDNLVRADRYQVTELLKQYKDGFKVNSGQFVYAKEVSPIIIDKRGVSYKSCYEFAKSATITKQTIIQWTSELRESEHSKTIDKCIERYGKIYANQSKAEESLQVKSEEEYRFHILTAFDEENEVSLSLAKKRLQRIYDKQGIKRTAKATDLLEFYPGAKQSVVRIDGKLTKIFKLKEN